MSPNYGREIIERLSRVMDINQELFVVDYARSDFGLIVAIILSQNTNDKNSLKALKNLYSKTQLNPNKIASMNIDELKKLIRVAGLHEQKAQSIRNIAKLIISKNDFLKNILDLPVEEARQKLISIPGIGKKTADVYLAIKGKRTIGVDTHAARVAKRLGLVQNKAGYETIRKALLETFRDIYNLDLAHRYLIALGRKWCKASEPRCNECPLRDICRYESKRT